MGLEDIFESILGGALAPLIYSPKHEEKSDCSSQSAYFTVGGLNSYGIPSYLVSGVSAI